MVKKHNQNGLLVVLQYLLQKIKNFQKFVENIWQ